MLRSVQATHALHPPCGLVVLALLLGLTLSACTPAAGEPQATDLLLVTIDTLRSDAVSAYGAGFQSTPAFDALAAQGVLLERHHAVISLTAPAHLSMFSGLLPSEHGLRRNGPKFGADVPYLPVLLAQAGYRTGAVLGASIMKARAGFARGFEVFDEVQHDPDLRLGSRYERTADEVVDAALEFLEQADTRPQFLWVHLYDPHEPYQAPERFLRPASATRPLYLQQIEPSAHFTDDEQLEGWREYEAEVRYADDQLGRLLAAWDSRARGRRALVVVTSDHGQGLGEHDYSGHGFHIYQEQLRVPFAIRFADRLPAGRRVAASTSAIDLPRTCLELLGLQAPGIGGQSLVELLTGATETGRKALLAERREWTARDLARNDEPRQLLESRAGLPGGSAAEQIALVRDPWKYIWTADGEHELYDLERDPSELVNRIADELEIGARMCAEIEAWRSSVRMNSTDEELDQETLDMLKALGY